MPWALRGCPKYIFSDCPRTCRGGYRDSYKDAGGGYEAAGQGGFSGSPSGGFEGSYGGRGGGSSRGGRGGGAGAGEVLGCP